MSAVEVDGEDAEFEHSGKNLVVSGDFVEGDQYELSIDYSGTPEPVEAPTTRADFSTTGFTVTEDGSAWTMQEPFGAYSWFAVNDQPSDKAFYDFTLRVPAPWTGIANGVMTSREEEDGQTVSEWHLDSKTSSYLVTVAFGDFAQTLDTTSESGVPITAWVPKGEPATYAQNLEYTPEALSWVEEQARSVPLVVARHPGRRLQQRHGDPDDDHAGQHRLHDGAGHDRPRDRAPVVRRPGHARRLARPLDERGHGDVPPVRLAVRDDRHAARAAADPGRDVRAPVAEGQRSAGDVRPEDLRGDPGVLRPRADVGRDPSPRRRRHVLGDGARLAVADPDGSSNRDDYLPWIEEQTGAELSDLFDGWLFAKRSPKFVGEEVRATVTKPVAASPL